jgi:hypothetical protein
MFVQHRTVVGTVLGLPRRQAWVVGAAMALAAVAYVIWFRDGPFLQDDSPQYLEVARDLRDGAPSRLHDRSIGYPLVLVATGSAADPTPALMVVQLAAHLVATWCAAVAVHRLGGGPAGTAVAVGLLLSPPLVEHTAYVMTESLTLAALLVAFLLVVRWLERRSPRLLVGAGSAIAAAALLRPTYVLLGVCGAGLLLIAAPGGWRGRVGSALALAAGSIALLGGASAYNLVRFDYAGLTPTVGVHLTTRTAHFVEALPDEHAALRAVLVEGRDAGLVRASSSHQGGLYYQAITEEVEQVTGKTGAELDRHLARINVELILHNPQEYLAGVGRSVADLTLPAFTDRVLGGSDAVHLAYLAAHYALVVAFGAAVLAQTGLLLARRIGAAPARRGPLDTAWWIAVGTVAYTIAVSALVETGGARLRVPADPLAVVVIATTVPLALALVRPARAPAASTPRDHAVALG